MHLKKMILEDGHFFRFQWNRLPHYTNGIITLRVSIDKLKKTTKKNKFIAVVVFKKEVSKVASQRT